MRVSSFENKVCTWAYGRGDFTFDELLREFSEKGQHSLTCAIYNLCCRGEINRVGKKTYNCNKEPEGYKHRDKEIISVSEFSRQASEVFAPMAISLDGRVIGTFTPS